MPAPVAPAAAAVAGVVALPVLAATIFLGSGAADPPPPTEAGVTCTVTPAIPPGGGTAAPTVPDSAPILTGDQAGNARTIVAAAKALGMTQQAGAVAIMVGMQESSLLNLANPTVPASLSYPHQGEGTNFDSLNVFQQRPSMGWGSVEQLMDPGYATAAFLRALAAVPGWEAMPAWQAGQEVQRSADGTLYAQWTELGTAVAAALWDGTTGTLTCTEGPTVGEVTGPGGTFAREACSVRPDPSVGRGCLTPRTLNVYLQLKAQGWAVSCWDAHAWNPRSDHPQGRACDVFPGQGGTWPTPAQKARGDALAASLQASAAQTGINYLVWYGRIWSVRRASEGWRSYSGGGVYNPGDVTGGHYDHVHVSVY